MNSRTNLFVTLTVAVIASTPASADVSVGACARATFEDYLAQIGGTFIDFQSLPTGTNLTTQLPGLSFASISTVSGAPAGPFHVEVSDRGPANDGNTIVGSPCDPSCTDDARVRYEIVFATPQRWAGVEREWGNPAVTRFFNAAGDMMAEQVTGAWSGIYVGWLGTEPDDTDWVARIEIDGFIRPETGNRMVGHTDDLMYGTADVSGVVDDCPLDVDCSGAIAFGDILELLAQWGECTGCRADVNGDGVVTFADLIILLGNWGACP